MEKTEEKPSDVILSFFLGLIGLTIMAGFMLMAVVMAYWYLYPMRCNFEAGGSFHPSANGFFSTSSDGTFNATSELLALNFTRNGSSAGSMGWPDG